MIKPLLIILTILISIPSTAFSAFNRESIYGDDNRVFTEDFIHPNIKEEMTAAIAAMIPLKQMQFNVIPNKAIIKTETMEDKFLLCPDEKFAQEITIAKCSSFLVGPDLLLTAGHCIIDMNSCKSHRFIFNFKNSLLEKNADTKEITVNENEIYYCKSIVDRKKTDGDLDYALVKLDRPVFGITPLKYRTEGTIEDNTEVVAVGHLAGIPQVSLIGKTFNNKEDNYFTINTDSFQGNSGGPVFNLSTGLVEGILVRGADDFEMDESLGCMRAKVYPEYGNEEATGEDVTRITKIPHLMEEISDDLIIQQQSSINSLPALNDIVNEEDNDQNSFSSLLSIVSDQNALIDLIIKQHRPQVLPNVNNPSDPADDNNEDDDDVFNFDEFLAS